MDQAYAERIVCWRVPLGFATGVGYLIFAQPTPGLLLLGGAIALGGVGVRTLAAGYLEKNRRLATAGPYHYTRNPLYFGSFIISLGLAFAGGSFILGVVLVGCFLAIYWPVMRLEESDLRQRFGDVYCRYAGGVPLFFPLGRLPSDRGAAPVDDSRFRWERYRRNREYRAALGYIASIVFLAAKSSLR